MDSLEVGVADATEGSQQVIKCLLLILFKGGKSQGKKENTFSSFDATPDKFIILIVVKWLF